MHVAIVMLLASVCAAPSRADDPGAGRVLRGGAFAQDITPQKLPISINGGYTDRLVTSVHDRLHARCLVLDDGTTKLVIVVCDSCALSRGVVDAAKQAADVALNEYKAGLAPFTTVIVADETDLTDRQTLLAIEQNRLLASVALIEALGGGWDSSSI